MNDSLFERLCARTAGVCLYGLAPPKQTTPSGQLDEIVTRQLARLQSLSIDGVIVYDIQDEGERISAPRPFPFLPTIDPDTFAHHYLASLKKQKIVYRCVNRDTPDSFIQWLKRQYAATTPRLSVLVGAPSQHSATGLSLASAYVLAQEYAPTLLLGGVAIAERHSKFANEHERILGKAEKGCRFFVTQAVYDVTSTKSLLSDYALALREKGGVPLPIILTFSPCGSIKTLSFMKWLGIAFPRWLENELRMSGDPLTTSVALCEKIFAEVWDYSRNKGIPIGVNVESVSNRKAEIDASIDLFQRLRQRMGVSGQ
jgi:5,10-methylenetetrahydrofolate reductase